MIENNLSFAISTLGCKVNQYESQVIRERLQAAGGREDPASPGLVVVNSCAVTARAEMKTRKCIRRWLRRAPRARLLLTGCGLTYSEVRNRSLWEMVPAPRRGELPPAAAGADIRGISYLAGHRRAFVKVQDGCGAFCSYCVIPFLRGRPVSRPPEAAVRETVVLVRNGYREIVLTGINLGAYAGRVSGRRVDLAGLVELLLKVEGNFRIRLSSIEPKEITPGLSRLIAGNSGLCPHLHIPLQSGSDRVLRLMNRNYTYREYAGIISSLRECCPEISISTDCLVGFPGESEDDFRATCRAIRGTGFSRTHVFPYSPRPGTRAAADPPVPAETVKRRAAAADKSARVAAAEYRERFWGRTVEVLIEKSGGGGTVCGFDQHYLAVAVTGTDLPPGSLCRVSITGVGEDGLRGVPAGEKMTAERSTSSGGLTN
ncbi:MAG: MiaB/RimO family radical SAM methylthiotransferase [PVC group bacterium]